MRQQIAGFFVKPLTEADRKGLGLANGTPAFRVTGFPPSWAKTRNRAAARVLAKGDVIVAVDGRRDLLSTESRFLAYLAQKKPKESVQLTLIREGKRQTVNLTLQ